MVGISECHIPFGMGGFTLLLHFSPGPGGSRANLKKTRCKVDEMEEMSIHHRTPCPFIHTLTPRQFSIAIPPNDDLDSDLL